ncbi:disulfide bond formation protein B [Candidatus Finniella inopinata]|uniref:disulfide bond formation protein B n=1 Tax=Candidatus Finniella inopinata TaxID=1696036 RepID=UPI0013EEC2EE|nr:disulfide bond formation protein B [Candidatus Finniella inopinata]
MFVGLSLAVAVGAEFLYHIKPCSLCVYLRYIYWGVLSISLALVAFPQKCLLRVLQFLAIISALGLSSFHAGVEQKWWQPPAFCQNSSANVGVDNPALTPQEKIARIRQNIQKSTLVRCDQISWRILGVSATIWNTLALAGLVVYLLIAFGVQRRCKTKP